MIMKSLKKKYPAVVWKEGDLYVAKLVNLELASQGKTQDEALNNLQEAFELLLDDDKKILVPLFIGEVKVSAVYA